MKNKIIVYIVFQFLLFQLVKADGLPVQFSQMFKTLEFVNPAYSAFESSFTSKLLYRSQWKGMDGAPNAYAISAYSPLQNFKLGLGANLITVTSGSRVINNAALVSNIDLQLNDRDYLAFGLQLGLEYSFFDKSKVISYNDVDVTKPEYSSYADVIDTKFVSPTMGVGFLYYNPIFYAGLSSYLMISDDQVEGIDFYLGSYFISGFTQKISSDWRLKETGLYKMMYQDKDIWEIGVQALYSDAVWIGTAYRHTESQVFLMDMKLNDELRLGVSYDINISELKRFTYGSFELRLEYRMKVKNFRRNKRKLFYLLD